MATLSTSDLQAFLQTHQIPGEILRLDVPTPTVAAAADAVGTHPGQIIKSILFLVDGDPVLTVTCGEERVDSRSVAAHRSVGRKRVKLADPKTVLEICGYEVGAMPPFGHLQPLPTLVDPSVLAQEEVYGGGGAENALLRFCPRAFLQFDYVQALDLHEPPSG